MRTFSLREKQSVITVLREPPKKQKKVPWQKWTFVAAMLFLLSVTIYKAVSNLWIIHANGQIEVKKQTVQFSDDIKIQEFYVQEGQTIERGDTLFRYKPIIEEAVSTSVTNFTEPENWVEKQRMDLQAKIAQKTFEMDEIQARINSSSQLAKMKKDMILLGSVNDKNDYEYLKLDINKMNYEKIALKKERDYLRGLLYKLKDREVKAQRVTTTNKSIGDPQTFFIANLPGEIGVINFNTNETCFRREEVLTIHQLKDMKIKVYFDPQEMKYLNIGDEVTITFPDGTESAGVIQNFHVATYALPEEFQKKYEPTTRNVVANVLLKDVQDSYKLMNFYKMNVRISKARFKFFS